jgi:hypothetical protein
MNIEACKWYLTAGGYLVYVISKNSYDLTISKETSAGVNYAGKNVEEIWGDSSGWVYSTNGNVKLKEEWSEKLQIVSEFKHRFPTLPSEYKWKDGYPQFRTPKRGEYFVRYDHRTGSYGPIVQCDRDFVVPYGAEERRFIVEPVEKNEFPVAPPKTLAEGYEWPNGKIEFRIPKEGEYYLPMSVISEINNLGIKVYKASSSIETAIGKYEGKRFIVSRIVEKPIQKEKDEWVEITDPSHIARAKIDWYMSDTTKIWEPTNGVVGQSLKHIRGYTPSAKLRCLRQDLPVITSQPMDTKVSHIPFDGPGQYELMNGQIVNLNNFRECSASDNIKNGDNLVYSWVWNKDGAINGIDLLDNSSLYLKRKISNTVATKPEEKIFGTVIANNICNHQFLTKGKSYSVYEKSNGIVFLIKDDAGNNKQYYLASNFDVFVNSDDSVVAQTPVSEKKEEEMSVIKAEDVVKVTKATGGFVGRMSLKALNYWVAEPIKEVATKVMRGVRYVTLGAGIVGGIYTYNNPEAAKETFKKCLPKIEFKIESPEILKS